VPPLLLPTLIALAGLGVAWSVVCQRRQPEDWQIACGVVLALCSAGILRLLIDVL
jgi:hypothetical protein